VRERANGDGKRCRDLGRGLGGNEGRGNRGSGAVGGKPRREVTRRWCLEVGRMLRANNGYCVSV